MKLKDNGVPPENFNIHMDFLQNEYFTARSLMTPRKECSYVDITGQNLEAGKEDAKKNGFSNLVVKKGDETVGFINVEDLKKTDWKDRVVKIDEKHTVSASMSLFKLAEKMAGDSADTKMCPERKRAPLYFVYDVESSGKEPIGIMTYWDFNRASSYILSYTILVVMEQSLFRVIKDTHNEWQDHCSMLDKFDGGKVNSNVHKFLCECPGHEGYNYSALSKWHLRELLIFYNNDEHVKKDLRIEESILKKLADFFKQENKIRNRIAHPVNLLVEDKDFQTDLKNLMVLWKYGNEAFLKYDDAKLRRNAPVNEDSSRN